MINTILFFLKLFVTACGMAYYSIIFRFFKKKTEKEQYDYVSKCARKYAKKLINNAKCKVEVIGREKVPEGSVVFIGNHQSFYDIPVLIHSYGHAIGFISKKEVGIPVLHTWEIEMKGIFIDREDIRKSIEGINEGIENLKKGYPIAIFPEGHRSRTGEILEFKKGSLRLGTKSGVPIIPVVIKGTGDIYENNKFPNKIKKADVKVCFLDPIYYNDLSSEDKKNITSIVRNRIIEKYNNI